MRHIVGCHSNHYGDARKRHTYHRGKALGTDILQKTLRRETQCRAFGCTGEKHSAGNRAYSRAVLLPRVWGFEYCGGTRTVDVHVRRLRAKLGGEYEHLIGTVRNVGYRFDPPEEDEHEAAAKDAAHGESGES